MIPFSTLNIWHEHNIWVYKCTSLLISRTLYLCKTPDNSTVDDPLTGYDVRPLESFVPAQLPSCRWHKQLGEIRNIGNHGIQGHSFATFSFLHVTYVTYNTVCFFHWLPSQFQRRTLGGKMEEATNCFSLFIFLKQNWKRRERQKWSTKQEEVMEEATWFSTSCCARTTKCLLSFHHHRHHHCHHLCHHHCHHHQGWAQQSRIFLLFFIFWDA